MKLLQFILFIFILWLIWDDLGHIFFQNNQALKNEFIYLEPEKGQAEIIFGRKGRITFPNDK